MIASIEGIVAHKNTDHVVILVGGIGCEVMAPSSTIETINSERVFLHTRLVVREDSLTLYGFTSVAERELFDIFLKISGIGPKLSLTILSTLSVDNVRSAVINEQPEILNRVPGIGEKTAAKIVLELKDKVPSAMDTLPVDEFINMNADVLNALTKLGYSVVEAQAAIQSLPRDAPEDSEARVFIALQYFGAGVNQA